MSRPLIYQDRDDFRLIDERGDLWRLRITGDPSLPLIIEIVERDHLKRPPESELERWVRRMVE